ncbi:hypothetical protein ABEB36_006910 [Hypothenemus hampei]|uniref:Uncharacterized protein n=1 Tax=Hypothenemus hampei TaxID=57062 RepID=A0ABD1ES52_HYPHA
MSENISSENVQREAVQNSCSDENNEKPSPKIESPVSTVSGNNEIVSSTSSTTPTCSREDSKSELDTPRSLVEDSAVPPQKFTIRGRRYQKPQPKPKNEFMADVPEYGMSIDGAIMAAFNKSETFD